MKKIGIYIGLLVVVLLVGVVGWLYFADYLDREKPIIKLHEDLVAIGKSKEIGISFSDAQSGLSNLKVELIQDNKTYLLAQEVLPSRGLKQKTIQVKVDTPALRLKNGPAIIKISARDFSLFKNEAVWAQQIKIDTIPPTIELFSTVNYINQGGTGFIAYRTSKPAALTGVYVNDLFSQGYTTLVNNRPVCLSFFALPMDATNGTTKIAIFARDQAGNETRISLPCQIKPKKFRSDKLNLGDAFLQQKMPEFQSMIPELQSKSLKEVFAYVNTKMREENDKTIQNVCLKSVNRKLWEGSFQRMQNGKPMALFGDQRTYLIDNKPFGNSTHMGIDLASTARAPIEAANSGIVVYSGPLGIYGNAVIIDHGLGLFSLYGHLTSIETTTGKNVKKAEKIGLSGLTGLAGGDHLHFGILVNGRFVNPVEWWDPHWIQDNVDKKMTP